MVVPLVLAAGLAAFYYRRYHQLRNAVEAHGPIRPRTVYGGRTTVASEIASLPEGARR